MMAMSAYDHAEYCHNIKKNLYEELYEVTGEKIPPVMSSAFCTDDSDGLWPVYCHPEDKDKRYVSNFDYPHAEV